MNKIKLWKIKRHWKKVYKECKKYCSERQKWRVKNVCVDCPFCNHPLCEIGMFNVRIDQLIKKEQK